MELHEPGAATAFDLAGAFLADVSDRLEGWPALLAEWCADRAIGPELRAEIRAHVQRAIGPELRAEIRAHVQRARVVQAVERHRGAA